MLLFNHSLFLRSTGCYCAVAGKGTSFTANRGQVKDMKQKTFELLQLAEDAEDEYDDEYDDGFDALNVLPSPRVNTCSTLYLHVVFMCVLYH